MKNYKFFSCNSGAVEGLLSDNWQMLTYSSFDTKAKPGFEPWLECKT